MVSIINKELIGSPHKTLIKENLPLGQARGRQTV